MSYVFRDGLVSAVCLLGVVREHFGGSHAESRVHVCDPRAPGSLAEWYMDYDYDRTWHPWGDSDVFPSPRSWNNASPHECQSPRAAADRILKSCRPSSGFKGKHSYTAQSNPNKGLMISINGIWGLLKGSWRVLDYSLHLHSVAKHVRHKGMQRSGPNIQHAVAVGALFPSVPLFELVTARTVGAMVSCWFCVRWFLLFRASKFHQRSCVKAKAFQSCSTHRHPAEKNRYDMQTSKLTLKAMQPGSYGDEGSLAEEGKHATKFHNRSYGPSHGPLLWNPYTLSFKKVLH